MREKFPYKFKTVKLDVYYMFMHVDRPLFAYLILNLQRITTTQLISFHNLVIISTCAEDEQKHLDYCILGNGTFTCTCTILAVVSSAGITCILFIIIMCFFFCMILFFSFLIQDEFCTFMQLEYAEKEDSYLRSKEVRDNTVFSLMYTSWICVEIIPRNKLLKFLSILVHSLTSFIKNWTLIF